MTRRVVLADVEYAERLLDAGCEDSAIIACLCWRGVGEEQAARLLGDLRYKRPVRLLTAHPLKAPANRHSVSLKERGRNRGHRPGSHGRRSVWRRVNASMRVVTAAMACMCVLASFGYVGSTAWSAAKARAEAFKENHPNYYGRVQRYQAGLPDTLYDFGEPRPARSGGGSGASLLQDVSAVSRGVTPTAPGL